MDESEKASSSNQKTITEVINATGSKVKLITPKTQTQANLKPMRENIVNNYLSTNSNKSGTQSQYSIANYKTPNQTNVLNNTPATASGNTTNAL